MRKPIKDGTSLTFRTTQPFKRKNSLYVVMQKDIYTHTHTHTHTHTPGEGNGNPFQYSCMGNPMHRGTWRATVHEVTKRQTRLSTQAPCMQAYTYTLLSHSRKMHIYTCRGVFIQKISRTSKMVAPIKSETGGSVQCIAQTFCSL